jgi:1-acyl-sn-glycerol-3-phosphate acyltransferase
VERDVGQLYSLAKATVLPLFHLGWRFDVRGLENVPEIGGAIMAPNHTSVIDSFFLPAVLPRRITYVGKAEYMDDWKTKYLFPALGMIPIDRSGGNAAQAALDAAAGVLDKGELFGIYPEGTRSRSGLLHKGHTGAARLARRTETPIVPVGLVGTREVQPPDAPVPRLFMTVGINIGKPIHPDLESDPNDPRVYRRMIDNVMFEISRLSGQQYVHEYATKKTDATPDGLDGGAIPPRRSSAEFLSGNAA